MGLPWGSWGQRTQLHSFLCSSAVRTVIPSWVILAVFLGTVFVKEQSETIQHQFLSHHIHLLKPLPPVYAYIITSKKHQLQSTRYSTEQKSVPVQLVCAFMCFYICALKGKYIVTAWASSWELQFSKMQFRPSWMAARLC